MLRNIICTGGAGKLGQHVARQLKSLCALTILDLKRPIDNDLADVSFRAADVTNLADMRDALTGADAVVHLAAIPNPRTAPAEVTFQTNVQGAWAVFQAEDGAVQ